MTRDFRKVQHHHHDSSFRSSDIVISSKPPPAPKKNTHPNAATPHSAHSAETPSHPCRDMRTRLDPSARASEGDRAGLIFDKCITSWHRGAHWLHRIGRIFQYMQAALSLCSGFELWNLERNCCRIWYWWYWAISQGAWCDCLLPGWLGLMKRGDSLKEIQSKTSRAPNIVISTNEYWTES
jgi:hypothetical protein